MYNNVNYEKLKSKRNYWKELKKGSKNKENNLIVFLGFKRKFWHVR